MIYIYFKLNQPCGIIYCRTRELTEEIATVLSRRGVSIAPYHAGKYITSLELI